MCQQDVFGGAIEKGFKLAANPTRRQIVSVKAVILPPSMYIFGV